jgi:hypothetical protein
MSIYFGEFQPHKVANTQLYIQRKDSTVSLCEDYSANGYDFTQGTAMNQPTLGTNSINFTSPQFMINNTANVFSGDNSGYIFFSGYFNNSGLNIILSSSDVPTNNHFFHFRIALSGKLEIVARWASGANAFVLEGDTVITNGSYYHGWISTNGSTWTAKINGSTQTLTATQGSNNGFFFDDIPNRDNLTIGAVIRSTPLYGSAQINKVHYVSGSHSALDVWKIEQFMSNPLNYI